MFSNKRLILLCDFTSVQDEETGDRIRVIVNVKKIIGEKELAGVNTQMLAQMQDMIFNYSIVVDRMFYKDQKYLFIDNTLYKIQSVSPAKFPKDGKLNVSEFHDENIENAIKEYLKKWFIIKNLTKCYGILLKI